jgi:hypothetical protein
MFVKPAPGLKVRDPDLRDFLPADGRDVPETDYWRRRVRDEDVIETQPPAPAAVPGPVQQ